jgi:hypothetical protein
MFTFEPLHQFGVLALEILLGASGSFQAECPRTELGGHVHDGPTKNPNLGF